MPTLEELEIAIIISVWKDLEWCESYDECFDLIQKGKQKIKALSTARDCEERSNILIENEVPARPTTPHTQPKRSY